MNRIKLVLAAALIALGGAAYWLTSAPAPTQTSLPPQPAGAAAAQTSTENPSNIQIIEMVEGNADAPITVVEYASFTCPHCRSFHENAYGQLKKNYIDTGKIKFVMREVYFDRFGLWAGMVARCDGPEKYFGIVDILFNEQQKWTAGGDPATIADNLRKIGLRAGMKKDQVNACMQDGEKAQAMVAVYQSNAEADGIKGTPTFVIDGETTPNMSYTDFSALLDKKLSEK